MQTQGGLDAEAAIMAPERRVFIDLKVDWNRNGLYDHTLSDLSRYVDNVNVDRSLTGNAPAEITLIEGHAAAELTFDLGGDHFSGVSWVAAFSPYNGSGPFYSLGITGAEVKYTIGIDTPVGIVWYPQFIGNITRANTTRADDTVKVTCLDRVEKLRRPIFMTDWAILDLQANLGSTYSQVMNSRWVIDHCLKHCNTSSSNWRWPDPEQSAFGHNLIFVSGNGGPTPNLGWVDGAWDNSFPLDSTAPTLNSIYTNYGEAVTGSPDPTIRPDMFQAMGAAVGDYTKYWSRDRDVLTDPLQADLRTHVLAFTLHIENVLGSQYFTTMPATEVLNWQSRQYRNIKVMMQGVSGVGKVWLRITIDTNTYDSPQLTIPTTGSTHARIVAEYDHSGTWRLRIYQNGALTAGSNTPAATSGISNGLGFSFHENDGLLQVHRKVALQDITVGAHTLAMTSVLNPGEGGVNPAYRAVLDKGLNALSFLPSRRGSLAWDVITEVAAAEFGAVFWDEQGTFRFWNQDTILTKKGLPVRTFSIDQVDGLGMEVSTDSVRNILSVTSKRARTQQGIVYETQGPDEYIADPSIPYYLNITSLWLDNVITPNSARPKIYAHPNQNLSTSPWANGVWTDLVQQGVVRQSFDNSLPGGPGWHHWTETAPGTPSTIGLYMYRGPDGDTKLRFSGVGLTVPTRFAVAEAYFTNSYIPGDANNQAALRWNGSKFTSFDDTTYSIKNDTSIVAWGPQGLPLESDWYQEFYNLYDMFTKLLTRTASPIPTTDAITIAGDPRLQLGDAIQIADPDGFGELIQCQILGISRNFSKDNGLVDTLSVEITAPTHIGVWDSPQYGLWDQSFYWSA